MKAIIAGSRTINDYSLLVQVIKDSGWYYQITEVVSGMAAGVDRVAADWAIENGIKLTPMPADWGTWGKPAGMIRNQEMAKYVAPDGVLIALWDGKSKGTQGMIDIARKTGLRVFIHTIRERN